jgi:hypothetical protein
MFPCKSIPINNIYGMTTKSLAVEFIAALQLKEVEKKRLIDLLVIIHFRRHG